MRAPAIFVLLAACSGGKTKTKPQAAPALDAAIVVAAPIDAAPALRLETIAGIERVMAPYAADDGPGCAVGVIRRGDLVLARGFGMADVAHGKAIDADTIFDLGSTSKQFTAAVIYGLAADGKLAVTDALTTYVPEVKQRRGRAITIDDLLHHTSGLPDYLGLLDAEYEDRTTEDDALRAIAAATPLREPGELHEYSNSGYFLLGLIAKRAGGAPLAELAAARIFGPLGMTSTRIDPTTPKDRARGYRDGAETTSGWLQVGDGAVLSTVRDLARWDARFYGDDPLVTPQLTPGTLDDGTLLDYAGGLYLDEHDGRATVSHAGAWQGFGAELLRFPAERVSVICLCNFDESDPETYALEIAELVLAE